MSTTNSSVDFKISPLQGDVTALRKWMLGLHETGELPMFRHKVNRQKTAKLLGVPIYAVKRTRTSDTWAWLRNFFDDFDEHLIKHLDDSANLNAKLAKLYETNKLPLHRGVVARYRLEQLLGLPAHALRNKSLKWTWAQKCVDEFDKVIRERGHGTVWEEKVPAIREHLENLHESKSLPINQLGDLNKKAILILFGLPKNGSTWTCEQRAPLLKELLSEYSKIVRDSDYTPYKYDYLEDALKGILASEEMPINYGRLVSVTPIAKLLGVSSAALMTTPRLMALIKERQRQLDLNLRRVRTKKAFVIGGVTHINVGATPWSERHRRIFDFTELIEPYGPEFAEKIGTVFIQVVSKIASPKNYFNRLKNFLIWLSTHNGSRQVFLSLCEGKLPDRDAFERSALTYEQAVIAEYLHGRTGSDHQRKLPSFAVITKFSDARVFPPFKLSNRMRSSRKYPRDRNPKPTLVEAQVKDAETVKKLTEQAAQYRGIEFDSNKDTIAFANTLAVERARRNDLPNDLIEAIAFLCHERLYELRKEASRIFKKWYETYQNGRRLVTEATHSGQEIKWKLDSARGEWRGQHWAAVVAKLFPQNDKDVALSNLLALVTYAFHGICPPGSGAEWDQFWRRTYAKVGGSRFVQAHLFPTSEAVSAAVCLYLCESGANPSVGLALKSNSVRRSKIANHVNIVSTKSRSLGKSIFNDLPTKAETEEIVTAAEALSILKTSTQSLREKKLIAHGDLLVFASNASVRKLAEWQFRADVKSIACASEALSEYTITPSMIRPTVLLKAELKNPGNLTIANMLAQHNKESTTMGYVAKLPYRMILEDRIRKYMETLQVVIASSIKDGYKRLGIEGEIANSMLRNSQRTGLGVFCSDPFSGEQADYPPGEKCKALDRCIECRKLLVVAHPDSIADMMIWKEALDRAQSDWLQNRYQRWEEVWTPWQAFFHVVLNEKMSRGELAIIKNQAEAIADKRKSSPQFVYPEPW